jgi:hypothetical protein
MAVPLIVYAAAAALGGYLILQHNKKAKEDSLRGTGGVLPPAPTAGTAAFDKPVVSNAAGITLSANASQIAQEQASIAIRNAAEANPAPPDLVALAAQQSGVSVADLNAAAVFMGNASGDPTFTGAQFVAMGATPRDIQDAVFQMKQAQGTLPGQS